MKPAPTQSPDGSEDVRVVLLNGKPYAIRRYRPTDDTAFQISDDKAHPDKRPREVPAPSELPVWEYGQR